MKRSIGGQHRLHLKEGDGGSGPASSRTAIRKSRQLDRFHFVNTECRVVN